MPQNRFVRLPAPDNLHYWPCLLSQKEYSIACQNSNYPSDKSLRQDHGNHPVFLHFSDRFSAHSFENTHDRDRLIQSQRQIHPSPAQILHLHSSQYPNRQHALPLSA